MISLSNLIRRMAGFRPWKVQYPRTLAVIALASLAWAFCYPPFPLGPLAFLVLAPLFAAVSTLSCRQSFGYGFAGGILYNIVMYWWIYNVVKVGPAFVIGAGLIVLILFLSLFNGILAWIFRTLAAGRHPGLGLAAFPFIWAGLEVLRTWGQMSFPWSHIGYALGHQGALIQASSFMGVFGLSVAVVGSNVLLFLAWKRYRSARSQSVQGMGPQIVSGIGRSAVVLPTLAAVAIPAALWLQGALSLSRPDPDMGTLDIGMTQPSIPQTKKWDEDYFQDVMQKTWQTMGGSASMNGNETRSGNPAEGPLQGADLIVLPETAVPDFLRSRAGIESRLTRIARENNADLVVGALDFEPDDKPYRSYRFFNSAFLFPGKSAPDTSTSAPARQYSKLRLVPFSERLPFDDIFPLINYVNLGEGDFSAGSGYEIWKAKIPYAPSICYEVIYPDFVRGARKAGAQLLVNITNDGWFGYSNAPFQHANITRFRAVETGMPIARSANSGISVFYDYKGRILGKTRLFEQTVLRRQIPLAHRDTVYLKIGDAVESLLAAVFAAGFLYCLGTSIKARRHGKTAKAGVSPQETPTQA